MATDLAVHAHLGHPRAGVRRRAREQLRKVRLAERNLIFDINDFDETIPGPWEWDVKRLCASMHVIGRQRGFDPARCDRIVTTVLR